MFHGRAESKGKLRARSHLQRAEKVNDKDTELVLLNHGLESVSIK